VNSEEWRKQKQQTAKVSKRAGNTGPTAWDERDGRKTPKRMIEFIRKGWLKLFATATDSEDEAVEIKVKILTLS
jgi:hypothetical protein